MISESFFKEKLEVYFFSKACWPFSQTILFFFFFCFFFLFFSFLLFLRFLFLMLCFHLSSFSRSYLKMSQSPHLLFLSFCVYFRHYPMLTLHCRFAFSSYIAISHSCCIPVAWFRVSFLSREKKTWKTMRWCCCSMLWKTSGSF